MDGGPSTATDLDALRYLSRGKRRILDEVMTTRHGGGEAGYTTIGFDFDKKRMSVDPSSSSPPKSHLVAPPSTSAGSTAVVVGSSSSSGSSATVASSAGSTAPSSSSASHSLSMSHGSSLSRKRLFSDAMSLNSNHPHHHELSVSLGGGTPLKRRSVNGRSSTPLRTTQKLLGGPPSVIGAGADSLHALSTSVNRSEKDSNPFAGFLNGGSSSSVSSSSSMLDHGHHGHYHQQYRRWSESMEELKRERDSLKGELFKLRRQLSEVNESASDYRNNTRSAMIKLVRSEAETERLKRQAQVLSDNERIGRIVEQHLVGNGGSTRGGIRQLWEDGTAFKDLKRRKMALNEEKNELSQGRKELTKARKDTVKELTELTAALSIAEDVSVGKNGVICSSADGSRLSSSSSLTNTTANTTTNNGSSIMIGNSSGDDCKTSTLCTSMTEPPPSSSSLSLSSSKTLSGMKKESERERKYRTEDRLRQISIEIEISKLRSSQLNRELSQVSSEESQLENERKLHVKASRLLMEEKRSYVDIGQVLNDRYVMINLLGKGGFSEVYRAYDLDNQMFVACKIHQLNSQWSDERKKNYSKHAAREYDIHKKMEHSRIVKLYDVFGIDISTFCTVLEYCDGFDLDIYLRMNHMLSEKESRCIMAQIFDALYYLSNECIPSIIHYDLKPGNILYHKGYAKITDFGLAKMIDVSLDEMELTSQGAGTYWYLPPECFTLGMNPPMISTAVDIFSAGVVFYQLLFGQRPFGDSMSQDRFAAQLKQSNMVEAVSFPMKPIVSDSVKLFIQECLNSNPKMRPTAKVICYEHPYFAHFRSF